MCATERLDETVTMTGNSITRNVSKRAQKLLQDELLWDMTVPGIFSGLNDAETLNRYRAAGYGFVSITVGNDSISDPDVIVGRIAELRTQLQRRQDEIVVVGDAAEILTAQTEGKLAISFHLQGTNALAADLSWVEKFRLLGITHMLLAYNNANTVGDGCVSRTDAGLSSFGKSLIGEMNRVGMIVDGSHCGHRTSMEAIELSTKPFIFSHSNAFSVFGHYRNICDDQIEACASTGGVVGINGVGEFLSETGEATAEVVFRHIDHIASLTGPQHVGLGFDFVTHVERFAEMAAHAGDQWPSNNGKPVRFDSFAPPEIIVPVVELMCRNGYADDDVTAVLGNNFFRVFSDVVGKQSASSGKGL